MDKCGWALAHPILEHYHDIEWGVPVHDDRLWFEFLLLEGAQAGLSWLTILKKRETYRRAFDNFDVEKIARYDQDKMTRLLADPGMVEYGVAGKTYDAAGAFSVGGYFYTGSFHQLWEQFLAACWIIGYTAVVSAILFYIVKFVCRGLREKDEVLEVGDLAIHDEEAYPRETFAERVSSLSR